jgi:hypothetical protein
MADGTSLFSPPAKAFVDLGGEEHPVYECRPCDMEAWRAFLDQFKAEQVIGSVGGGFDGADLNLDLNRSMELFMRQPQKICALMAVLVDPDPLSPEGAGRCRERERRLMLSPVNGIAAALTKWIEVNCNFFVQATAPLLLGAAPVLRAMAEQIMQRALLTLPSHSGSA